MHEFWNQIINWPPIVQGALGSALFWAVQAGITRLAKKAPILTERFRKELENQTLLREYVYRKYTSRNGLLYFTQGYFLLFSRALRHIVEGLVFMSVALLLAGVSPIAFSICGVGGLWFFGKALTWLVPSGSWQRGTPADNWERVVSLEKRFYGEPDQDTLEFLAKTQEDEPPQHAPAADAASPGAPSSHPPTQRS